MNSSVRTDQNQSKEIIVQRFDAVETYFECITMCSLDDGECISLCVDSLRESSH